MSLIRNLLALIGIIAIASGIFFYGKIAPEIAAFKQLDPGAKSVYLTMWEKLKETGNSAEASVWKLSLIHISEPTRLNSTSRMPSSA